jgi:phosphomannomutase
LNVVCSEENRWRVFTGNEIGVILGHCQIQKYLSEVRATDSDIEGVIKYPALVLASIVSSRMLKRIADTERIHYTDTLTGLIS